MLLLDEPTNHLDAESVAWLERFLHDFEGTVVAITHDRYFLDNVAGWILELDRGEPADFHRRPEKHLVIFIGLVKVAHSAHVARGKACAVREICP